MGVDVAEHRDGHISLFPPATPVFTAGALDPAVENLPGKESYVWENSREMTFPRGWGEPRLERAAEGQGGGPGASQRASAFPSPLLSPGKDLLPASLRERAADRSEPACSSADRTGWGRGPRTWWGVVA